MKRPLATLIIGLTAVQLRGESPVEEALDIYSEVTGRTILRPGLLPAGSASIISSEAALTDTNRALTLIVNELAKKDLQVVPDGDMFARVLYPASRWSNSPAARYLSRIPPPVAREQATTRPAVVMDFRGVDLQTCLNIYADMRRRIVLLSSLGNTPIYLRIGQSLTDEEATYAMHVLLALNGIAAVDDGDRFVQMVPIPALVLVKTNAPKFQPDAPLLDVVKLLPPEPEAPVPAGRIRLPSQSPLEMMPSVERLVELYASLTDQKAIPSEGINARQRVPFKVQIPVTKEELLYAIDRTLALSGLAIISAGDKTIQASLSPEVTKHRH